MHKLSTLLLVLLSLSAFSQNLVPNWSFEEYEECPEGLAEIVNATGWKSFRLSPDYYHMCSTSPESSIPDNYYSQYQTPLEGEAYAGFGQIYYPSEVSEVLAIELSQPLEVGTEYYVSFYVSRGRHQQSNCWTDKIGAKFTVNEFEDWPEIEALPITNSAHILYEGLITDTLNWTKVEAYLTADSSYTHLSIGNNFDLDQLTVECDNNYDEYVAYYFVDCVCVSTDPVACDQLLSDNSLSAKDNFRVFPNPIENELTITKASEELVKRITLYGPDGRQYDTQRWHSEQTSLTITTSDYSPGIYYLSITLKNEQTINYKLIKH